MSSIMKVFLLLAVMFCIAQAQYHDAGQQCLCQRVRDAVGRRSEIKDVQINPANIFCNKVEIVVTMTSGLRYCVNPELRAVKRLVANMQRRQLTSDSLFNNTAQ